MSQDSAQDHFLVPKYASLSRMILTHPNYYKLFNPKKTFVSGLYIGEHTNNTNSQELIAAAQNSEGGATRG